MHDRASRADALDPSLATGWSRRRLLQLGTLVIGGVTLAGLGLKSSAQAKQEHVPPFDPTEALRAFNRGTRIEENGRSIRVFEVEAQSTTVPLGAGVLFRAWTLEGRIPGPTLRAQQGERIRVVFHNGDSTSHSLHFHGVHPADMDGIRPVRRGGSTVYEFDAESFGLYPYHCHVAPVTRHVSKGLYGLLIVDPPSPRPAADEMVLVMGGYDLKGRGRNDLYAFNGRPNLYRDQPITIVQGQRVRLYLLNMVEWDGPLTFHLHANLFDVFRGGFSTSRDDITDVITMGMAERHILEFTYRDPGLYMFHPHQDQIAERGCMGHFRVVPGGL